MRRNEQLKYFNSDFETINKLKEVIPLDVISEIVSSEDFRLARRLNSSLSLSTEEFKLLDTISRHTGFSRSSLISLSLNLLIKEVLNNKGENN
jgi:hypothetical protein